MVCQQGQQAHMGDRVAVAVVTEKAIFLVVPPAVDDDKDKSSHVESWSIHVSGHNITDIKEVELMVVNNELFGLVVQLIMSQVVLFHKE